MQETATAPPLIAGWPSPALLVESTQSVQRCPVVQRSGALALGRSAVVLRLPRPCDVDRLAVLRWRSNGGNHYLASETASRERRAMP